MEDAVNNLRAAGIVVVVSAGNDGGRGCSSISNPAAVFAGSFTVGATNSKDSIARFSSRGPVTIDGSNRMKPDVSAPGVQVLSQLPDSSYAAWNGTSMAGPHVAGLVALMISANPKIAGYVETIEDIIRQQAIPKTQPWDSCDIDGHAVPNNIYGHGRINALAAVKEAIAWISTESKDNPFPTIKIISPVSDNLLIHASGLEFSRLSIIDAAGRNYGNLNVNNKSHNVASLIKGLYFLQVELSDGRINNYKFLKL